VRYNIHRQTSTRYYALNLLPIGIGVMAILASLTYVAAEPYFNTFPAKVFQIQISRTGGGLGSDVNIFHNITQIGTASATILDKSRLESVPPIHSYLIMTSGVDTTYAVVFWQSSANGTQYISFSHLMVIVPATQDPVTFTFSTEGANDVQLGTY
jgi:hypothetical protein